MGRVHLAVAEEPAAGLAAGTRVALKVIHPHLLETPGFFKRFLREAEIGRSVHHENVVRTYDCDQRVLAGVPYSYLVMEYVEGQTLRALLDELEVVPESLCRHIGREVAKGLAAVHATGFVHRDLKPENVLITPEHVVKVMDLGVARLQDEAIRLSQTGAFVGSIHYAAPEQFRQGGDAVDERADLHALGTMLYELSTGTHPFVDEDTRVVLRRILQDLPRRCGELNPQLSPFFEEVVHALLAKERDERFAPATLLRDVLTEGEESDWWKERATALRERTRRPLRRMRIVRETALYGRDRELAALRDRFERACAGEGQVVLLEGEAGVGKTRLIDEFSSLLEAEGVDAVYLFGAWAIGGAATALGAFAAAFREYFGEARLEASLLRCLAETPLLVPAFAALLRGEPVPEGAEALQRSSLQTLIVRTVRAIAAERPAVVFLEDLHLAPDEGLALFASLALGAAEHRILVVGTMRPGVSPAWSSELDRVDHLSRLDLGRLGARDLTLLLGEAFHSEQLAERLAGGIALKSDGNPFFVFEVIRALRETRSITERPDGSWATTGPIPRLPVPSTVVDLVLARVADLDTEDRELLEVAACCGFEFDPLVAAEAAGLESVPALKRFGQIEKRHRLVRSQGRRMVFDHHQVREFLYERTLAPLREAYHEAIAIALERRAGGASAAPGDLDGAAAVEICEHAARAADPTRTRRYLDPALRHLGDGFEHDRVLAMLDGALSIPDCVTGRKRVEILLSKPPRLDLLGRRDEQKAVLEEAAALADAVGDPALRSRVRRHLGWRLYAMADYEAARRELATALDLAVEAGSAWDQAWAHGMTGHVHHRLGEEDDARAHYERWLALARETGDHVGEAQATGSLGNLCFVRGKVQEARRLYEAYLARARANGTRTDEAVAIGNLGVLLRFEGRLADALAVAERRLVLARETGDRRGEAIARGNLGALLLILGAPDEAEPHFCSSRDIARETGSRREETNAVHGISAVLEVRGARKEAQALCEEALSMRRALGDPASVGEVLLSLGRVAVLRGNAEDAREYFTEAFDLGVQYDIAPQRVLAGANLAAFESGGATAAEDRAERTERAAQAEGDLSDCEARLGCTVRMAAHYLLWQATGSLDHLRAAKDILDHLVRHAPPARRAPMLERAETHRDIVEAWAEHGPSGGEEPLAGGESSGSVAG